jgi:uncharacterized RDD family membrane protein YckC
VVSVFIAAFAGGGIDDEPGFAVEVLGGVIGAVLAIAYFVLLESSRGQTLGKMAMSIEVVGPDGNNPSPADALKRNAWMALSAIPVVGGFIQFVAMIVIAVTIGSNKDGTGLHDQIAGTRVFKKV